MAKRLQLTFKFFNSVEEANMFCNNLLRNATKYQLRVNKVAQPPQKWNSSDGKETKYLVWYYE